MDNDFDSVSWQNEGEGESSRPSTSQADQGSSSTSKANNRGSSDQAGIHADGVDLAGVHGGSLECTVSNPLKENDGTQNAYVSYLVTTNVCLLTKPPSKCGARLITNPTDRFRILPETYCESPAAVHRFRLPLQGALQAVSAMRRAPSTRQAADGIRSR